MKNLSQSDVFRLEGNLLSADFIQDLSVLKTKYQSATDYNILPGLHVKEEIGRSWRISNAIWSKFQRKDKVGSATVQYWLQPLLNDALGFNDLTLVPEEALGNRSLPIHYQSGTTPILLLPHTFPLDQSDSQLSAEGRRKSPHSLLQESLNATREQSLWGFVSNGYFLRLLRQNPSLTRPAYIEIDLFRIFTEDRYADFFTCWLLLHRSRFSASPEAPHHSILEQWHQTSQETGERALENLREGVKNALKQLGNGFLTHSNNQELKNALRSGTLTTEAYFNQLLRLVYRLILLYTAEDRNLLHSPESTQEQRDIYAKSYSAEYLRGRALQRSHDSYSDLWQGLLITFYGLGAGAEPIGLPNLGGLFSENQCPDLDHAELGNRALLAAIRSTCFFHSGTTLTRINYRDRNTEELGSVYESLLELQPILRLDAHPPWRFLEDETEGSTKGSTKKLTGSYYTPKELVQELIHSALEPVIATALRLPAPRAAVLGIKVLDPASGSGNFLLAAARRIAHELVRIDADDNHPETQAFRIALRDVVSHCIYGVDANPLAVELCKTALWLETLEPGKPLGFLDHHIRHGNSLVGILHPEVMKNGIPEEAYSALSGDDPEICKQLKGSLRAQGRARQRKFSYTEVDAPYAKAYAVLEAMPEDTPGEVQAKSRTHSELETNLKNSQQRLCADLFCATFFIPKNRTYAERIPFSEDLRLVAEGATLRPGLAELAQKISSEHHFFHWPLVFPEVFSNGGFDVVLANPPWKRLKLQEQEFFGTRRPDIANAQNAAARSKMILALHSPEASPADHFLYQHFIHTKRSAEASSLFAHKSGRFPLTGIGDVNSYALFSETISQLAKEAGILVPSGIATDDSTKTFFGALTEDHRLVSLYDFENREKLFPAVHSRMKFCALTLGKETSAKFIFFATKVEQLQEEHRAFRLSREEIVLLNPNTHTCPVFRSQTDAELTKKIYQHVPVLLREKPVGNPWGISFLRMFDMSNDSHLFRTADQLTPRVPSATVLTGSTPNNSSGCPSTKPR